MFGIPGEGVWRRRRQRQDAGDAVMGGAGDGGGTGGGGVRGCDQVPANDDQTATPQRRDSLPRDLKAGPE